MEAQPLGRIRRIGFQTIVRREDYVAANSLTHGSRAFSFLAGASGWQRWFFIGLGAVATVFIVWLLARHRDQRLFCWALALVLGGAVGNVLDRILHGHVVDFIQVHWHQHYFPSFNVADSAISIGAALLILDELRRVRRAS